MKRKILVFTPFIALLLAGCNFLGPRFPLPPTSGQSTSTKPTSTTTPTPVEDTYGTLDNPISVARAIEIGNAIAGASSEGTVYETKDAYIKGYVQSEPERGDTTEYRFNIADSYEATTNIQFYWGFMESGVSVPIVGDEVVVFGRLANYKTRTIELAGKKLEGEAGYEIEPPSVLRSNHVDCTITLGSYSHGTVTGVPATAVQNGTKVELVATPDEGYYVGSIKAYGQTLVEEGGKYSFTAYSSTTVSVEFVAGQKSAIQEAYEAAIAAEGSATTEEYTFSGVVTAITGNSFYVQDGTYGMYVYNKATANNAVGKIVSVTATVKTYNGLPETDTVSKSEVTGEGTVPTPIEITSIASISAVNVNMLANVQSATFVSKTKDWTSSNTGVRGTFTIGSDNVTVNFDKYGYDADKAALFNGAQAGDEFQLLNVVTNIYKTSTATTHQLSFAGTSTIISKAAPVVPVTGVKLNTDKLDFVLGGSAQTLTATVEPSDATNKKVSWSVNPTGIVTVNNGSVSPSAVGDAVVTVTTEDGNKTATCNVHVGYPAVTTVTVSPSTETLVVGEPSKTLSVTVEPELAEDKSVTWSVTEGSQYVSVDQQGNISPLGVGTAIVTATSNSNPNASGSCTVTVTSNHVDVSSVTVAPTTLSLEVGGTSTLTATVLPEDASDKSVTWSSSDSTKVSVNSTSGAVEALALTGNNPVTITATSVDDPTKSGSCEVSVVPTLVTAIEVSPSTLDLEVGDTQSLSVTVTPSNATDKSVTWSSSDSTKVSVNSTSGAVEALAATDTAVTITATANDGSGITGTCAVTVSEVPTTPSLQVAYEAAIATGSTESTDKYKFTGTLIGTRGNSFYLQDGEYGIYVYSSQDKLSGITDTKIEVEATVKLYNGLVETATITSVAGAGSGDTITPLSVTSKKDMSDAKQNILATANDAVLKTKSGTWSGSANLNTTFTIGSDDVTVFFDKYTASSAGTEVVALMNNAVVGQTFDLTNFVSSVNNNNVQLVYTPSSTITLHEEHATAIAFKETSYDVLQGATKNMSEELDITPASSTDTVTYSVSGNSGVSIDSSTGVVTVSSTAVADSTATVTATITGLTPAQTTIVVKASSPTTESYKLVSDVTTLADGDKIVIANADMTLGMQIYESGNNCRATAITVADNVITSLGSAGELVLESAGNGRFYIKSGSQYLYAASSSGNQLKAKNSKDSANGVWEFTYSDGVMGIVAYGSSNRNVMRYNPNNGSPIFSCYASTSTTGTLMQVFRLS